jgi:prepilin-type N-terminal cleavage/methylation domain-containing protein
MNAAAQSAHPEPAPRVERAAAGFTLIEMIGVLAIMTVLASVMTPNLLHSIERTAVRAEADNLRALGEEMKLYLRDNAAMPSTAVPPTVPNWTTQLATYSSLSSADILTNRRQMARLYVTDPVAANQRALLISSMRTGVALPTYGNVSTNFTAVWNTADGAVPVTAGWGAWNAGNIEYLVIERVSLAAVYRTDLQTFNVTLNNHGAVTTSYQVTQANGTVLPSVNLAAGASTAPALTLRPKDRLALYRAAGAVTLDYSYVVSTTGKTFDFTTTWTPQ